MNSVENIIKLFDNSIRHNKKAKVYRELFILTNRFTLEDWSKIRNEIYWKTIDSIKDYHEKKEYTLKCVKLYLDK